jgi:hypothetical protein
VRHIIPVTPGHGWRLPWEVVVSDGRIPTSVEPAPKGIRHARSLSKTTCGLVTLAVLAAACGTQISGSVQTPTVSTSRTSPPPPPPHVLIVVSDHFGYAGSAGIGPGVVQIMRLDGTVVARASFQKASVPIVGAGLLAPPDVVVAAGGVYFSDAVGVIRRLDPTGTVTTITTFPLSSPQQLMSFAVSPDGNRLGATILSLPPPINPQPTSITTPGGFWAPGIHAYLDLEWADAGGSERTALHEDLGTDQANFMTPTLIAGWDANSPLATLGTQIATQSGVESRRFQGASLIHLGQDGSVLDALGGEGCQPVDLTSAGVLMCLAPPIPLSLQVRTTAGQALWSLGSMPCGVPPVLSPGGDLVACSDAVYAQIGSSAVAVATYPPVRPGYGQDPQGWIDNSTLVYNPAESGLGWAQLPNLTNFHRLTKSVGWMVGVVADVS